MLRLYTNINKHSNPNNPAIAAISNITIFSPFEIVPGWGFEPHNSNVYIDRLPSLVICDRTAELMGCAGIEPVTNRLKVYCSTN